jgi:hypothetical protein
MRSFWPLARSRPRRRPFITRLFKRILVLGLLALPIATAVATDLPLCPLAGIFGIPCPGCGLSRASLAALRGDFSTALQLHPLVFWVAPVYVFLVGGLVFGYVRGTPPASARPEASDDRAWQRALLLGRATSAIAGITIALLLGVWVARFFGLFGGPVPVQQIRNWRSEASHVEAEVHHVSVAHDVVLADDRELARFPAFGLAPERH